MAKETRYKIQVRGAKSSNPDEEYEWNDYTTYIPGTNGNNDLTNDEVQAWMKAFHVSPQGLEVDEWVKKPAPRGPSPAFLKIAKDRVIIS